ncbi:hypothetical protein KIN20_002806 [Parelaphostrongylus tenuis]|uniref:Neurotransmitter-gated ion-channel ligand-binding domain-containing protein n=1 Tax=Parelaphostrongylus tenuis TaxID=148309 RepID=A0AAD5QFM0_PARTN|nr:hypothetical protein KIN20_002806 [Parelaphostrongylus tenuis]
MGDVLDLTLFNALSLLLPPLRVIYQDLERQRSNEMWVDKRISWNSSEYSNIKEMKRRKSQLDGKVWLPKILSHI